MKYSFAGVQKRQTGAQGTPIKGDSAPPEKHTGDNDAQGAHKVRPTSASGTPG